MSKFRLLSYLHPARLADAVGRRGLRGALWHALRRLGTRLERPLAGPALLRINPMGALCNHACPMCWRAHTEPARLAEFQKLDRELGMRLPDYVRLFQAMPPGLAEVNLVGGGEPLLHPEAVAIMSEIKRRGWRGELITNGTLLTEPVARALVVMRWDGVRVSVHAGDRETYHRIHGVDRFAILCANLACFNRLRREAGAQARCGLILFHVIQRDNIASIDKLFAIAAEVGADSIFFEKIILHPGMEALTSEELGRAREGLAAAARLSSVPCNLGEILNQLRVEELAAGEAAGEGRPFRPAARCSVGFDQVFINSAGEVLPCCFSPEIMGRLGEQPFGAIWRGKKYQDFRRRLIRGEFPQYCRDVHCALPGVLHE